MLYFLHYIKAAPLSRTRARPQMPEQPARKTSLVEIVYNQVKEDLDITEEIPS